MKNEKGFTYIELIVVFALLAILATISIPQFVNYRTKAHNAAALSDLKNVKTILEMYYQDNGEYP